MHKTNNYWLNYLRTWFIIKRKQFGKNLSVSKSHNYTKFVIVCAPRTGATWLHTLLNSHSQIYSYGEILRKTVKKKASKKTALIKNLVYSRHQARIKAVGFKLFYEYESDTSYQKWFQQVVDDKSILVIHLRRNDVLAQYVSLQGALASQQWSKSKKMLEPPPIHVDRDKFLAYRKEYLELQSSIIALFKNHQVYEIIYEDLYRRPELTLAQIQHYLKVKRKRLFSLIKKQSNKTLEQKIANWDEF